MAVGKTYVTGNYGLFQVYDHITDVWTDYTGSIPGSPYLTDVKTDGDNPNHAIICGINFTGYTTDAGATIIPSTYSSPSIIIRGFQISIPESVTSAIYVCGAKNSGASVIKSTDGGITFTDASTGLYVANAGTTALSLHFINNQVGVVVEGTKIWKTTNGAATWTLLNSIPGSQIISGVHMSSNEQVIVVVTDKNVYRSTNGGLNFVLFFTYSPPYLESAALKYTNLTWYDDNNMWISGGNAPIFYSADAGITWTEVFPESDVDDGRTIWGSHFYTLTEGFITVDDGAYSTYVTYKIIDANTSFTLAPSLVRGPYRTPATAVWTLVKNDIYALYDCQEEENPIYSNSPELDAVVGKTIKIEGSTSCWEVFLIQEDEQTLVDVVIATNSYGIPQIFDDCECCLPPVPPEPVKYTRVIPKPDKKFYQITQSQCDVQGNIRFADAYYRLFKNLKYGINSQCDTVNLEKVWIKKQLSDLAVINDPTSCVIVKEPVTVICPEPQGDPFVPVTAYYFTIGSETGNFYCDQCFDGSTPEGQCPQFNLILDYDLLEDTDPFSYCVINYDNSCLWTYLFTIAPGSNPALQTYVMNSSNITISPVEGGPPACDLCEG
jgi:hypothetical protein